MECNIALKRNGLKPHILVENLTSIMLTEKISLKKEYQSSLLLLLLLLLILF